MTSDPERERQHRADISPLDLKQIMDAVRELRASNPRSVLVDLVEEKIRAMESGCPALLPERSPIQERRIGG